MTIDGLIPSGSSRYFEYHCEESHDSGDAQLWYRSHRQVVVGECVNAQEYGDLPQSEREDCGHPLVYEITFADGFQGNAFEDELLESPRAYCRPDPPQPLKERNLS